MLNSFLATACAAGQNPGAMSVAATKTGSRRETGFMGQSSLSIGIRGDRGLARHIDANPAIEVSRAFIPPCTWAISLPKRWLLDQTPCDEGRNPSHQLDVTIAISMPRGIVFIFIQAAD